MCNFFWKMGQDVNRIYCSIVVGIVNVDGRRAALLGISEQAKSYRIVKMLTSDLLYRC